MMNTDPKTVLDYLETLSYTNKEAITVGKKRLEEPGYTKTENPVSHFCTFCAPINTASSSIFMGHHIKADDWVPPGGHMELGESVEDTVRREFQEELQYTIADEKITYFDFNLKHITNPKQTCKTHHDFWALIEIPQYDFTWDPGEFHDAKWMSFEEAAQKMKLPEFREILLKIPKFYF